MPEFIKCTFASTDEIILAYLSEYDFDSFEELENETIAYIKTNSLTDEVKSEIEQIFHDNNVNFNWEETEDKNWNEIWEASFQPIFIEDKIAVRATFHTLPLAYPYEIIINPKMAFGTGHHATTYMMMDRMKDLELKGKAVFDYGCGTGILAIFASMLGAKHIYAIDIENESYLNTIENCEINHIKNVTAQEATLDQLDSSTTYDIILANINRNVLLDSVQKLSTLLDVNDILLISGILVADETIIEESFAGAGLKQVHKSERENWLCIEYHKK